MRYLLKAVSHDGRVESLDLQGFDESSALQQAQNLGYTVLAVRPRASFGSPWSAARKRFPVDAFTQDLLVLLDAGLPLVESIEALAERERHGEFRVLLQGICAIVREGRPLSAALKRFPNAFPALYIATVQASETTSDLVPALQRFVDYLSQVDEVRKRLIAASIYPLLLTAVGTLVSLFLLLYVVPRFSGILEERGTDLPFFSGIMLAWGQLIRGHGALAGAAIAGAVLTFVHALRQPAIRAHIENALWRLPAVGERLKLYQLARFYRTTGMLLRGGVPLLSALQMGSELLHPALRAQLASASRAIREGRPLTASMEADGLTTPVAARMLAVGERSGRMGEMMERIAAFQDEEIARWVDRAMRMFEPLLMAAIGLAVGAVVILMYMPIFELAGSLQ